MAREKEVYVKQRVTIKRVTRPNYFESKLPGRLGDADWLEIISAMDTCVLAFQSVSLSV